MGLSAKSLAGPGYIILNGLRACNITCLLAVIIASMVMLVKTAMASKFYFFDGVSHVITTCVGMFLIVSELSLFRSYFARNWPLLSPSHGFVTLGLAMFVLGINILGNLNKKATSSESLGLAFWRIVIGSGVLVLIFGFLNIIASYLFRDRVLGVTARQVRSKGAVAIAQQEAEQDPSSKSHSFETQRSPSTHSPIQPKTPAPAQMTSAYPITPPHSAKASKEGRGPAFRIQGAFGRRPTLPSYHASPAPSSKYSDRGVGEKGIEISAPLNINPQFAHLVTPARPNSAYHPSRANRI